ncbi:hypothetical protein [Paramicrobacterium chengjingii]|uniref:hypothetical protein n=1 Tax=Paramicrobacterium chengjingii TaxID=2769067 RepID=UPI00142496E7|nr:hypothetical protein [Microbacterium chengjingii]
MRGEPRFDCDLYDAVVADVIDCSRAVMKASNSSTPGEGFMYSVCRVPMPAVSTFLRIFAISSSRQHVTSVANPTVLVRTNRMDAVLASPAER